MTANTAFTVHKKWNSNYWLFVFYALTEESMLTWSTTLHLFVLHCIHFHWNAVQFQNSIYHRFVYKFENNFFPQDKSQSDSAHVLKLTGDRLVWAPAIATTGEDGKNDSISKISSKLSNYSSLKSIFQYDQGGGV